MGTTDVQLATTTTATAAAPTDAMETKKSFSKGPGLFTGYLAFACICFTVGEHYSERDFSSILTLANAFHMLGMVLLRARIECKQSVVGISAKTIVLSALACVFRLSSTTWLLGYIPTDPTGNWVYQAFDIVSFVSALMILHAIHRRFAATYEASRDDHSPTVLNIFMFAVLLGNLAHGDLNDRPIFDILWFIGFYLDCLAALPQILLLWHSSRGTEQVITGHYVWPIVVKAGLSYAFFFYAFSELGPEDCPNCVNYVGYALIVMHSLQLAFMAALAALKLEKSLTLPDAQFTSKLAPEVELLGLKPQPSEAVRLAKTDLSPVDLEEGCLQKQPLKMISI